MWSPDVYEGAPIPINRPSYLSPQNPQGLRCLFGFSMPDSANTELMQAVDWPFMLAIVSALTMTVGNLAALPQQNVKRLLAYSSIAHGGYLLMGGVLLTSQGIGAILFYLVVYLFMNLGAFYVVVLIANEVGSEMVDGYRGLSPHVPP